MTEKEKQQAGELYLSNDKELVADRIKAKKLCADYNASEFNDFQKRERLLDRLVALKGENVVVEPHFYCDYGYNIIIGDNFYANHNLVILDCAEVVFGNNIFIGPNCGFYTPEHPIDAVKRNKGLESAKPIKVGNDVWIGGNVTVIGGVTIGDNVVIGAGSVVVKDIPSNCMAVGNPCTPIRTLDPIGQASEKTDGAAENAPVSPKNDETEKKTRTADEKTQSPISPRPRRLEIHRVDPK